MSTGRRPTLRGNGKGGAEELGAIWGLARALDFPLHPSALACPCKPTGERLLKPEQRAGRIFLGSAF